MYQWGATNYANCHSDSNKIKIVRPLFLIYFYPSKERGPLGTTKTSFWNCSKPDQGQSKNHHTITSTRKGQSDPPGHTECVWVTRLKSWSLWTRQTEKKFLVLITTESWNTFKISEKFCSIYIVVLVLMRMSFCGQQNVCKEYVRGNLSIMKYTRSEWNKIMHE